ncbi:type IV pilus modification protein PilV [Marinobacter sp. M3C]|uniref:type IV pilus modification protein PilV n=1 Tax=Marinobacter sp. M3C TaxID=2917715 RepID=UPI00200D80EB|nr:type IV pilus modification protein PilV [Marinobacter sp. M3C]MCL1486333.1 type IV pilus modification protein PilV [Marinobacter sp.]
MSRKPGASQSGITMIEVLVAVLVLAVGLLGVAGLQSLSLKNTTTAHFAQEAQSYSDDLINRIMANNQAADNGAYAYANSIVTSAPTPDCSAGTCSSAEMAAWDLWQWNTALKTAVGAPPAAAAKVLWIATDEEYDIAITWNAARSGGTYTVPTCTAADNSAEGCYFTAYRLR